MPKKGKSGCIFKVASVGRGFTMSTKGYAEAVDAAIEQARESEYDETAFVSLACPGGGEILLVGCDRRHCFPAHQGYGSDVPIAGLGRVKKPRRSRVKKPRRKRTGPPTAKQRAAQERFSNAAARCKGEGDYRSCMKRELKK